MVGDDGLAARDPRVRRRIVLAVSALAVLVVASLVVPLLDRGETYEVVFPLGTSASNDQASVFSPVPHRRVGDVVWLELEPGDTLLVRNLDTEVHQVAGVAARPGETVLYTFRERGVFSDACSLELTVFVEVGAR